MRREKDTFWKRAVEVTEIVSTSYRRDIKQTEGVWEGKKDTKKGRKREKQYLRIHVTVTNRGGLLG